MFDIDAVTKADTLRPTVMHDNEDVENIYNSIVKVLEENTEYELDLLCLMLTKPTRVEDGENKHGFNLHFPKVLVSKEVGSALTKKLPPYTQKPSLVVDNVIGKPWLLYGATKKPGQTPFTLTSVFGASGLGNVAQKMFEIGSLRAVLTIRHDNNPRHRDLYEPLPSLLA